MPDPKNYNSEDAWMSACVPRRESEGDKHDQAVAACLNMWRNKETDEKERPLKSEGDGKHPSSHYLVVEDPQSPDTWHLRVRDTSGKPNHRLMGGAWAALHGGYRGNKYQGPNKQEALAKLRRLYSSEGLDTPAEKGLALLEWAQNVLKDLLGIEEKDKNDSPFMVWKEENGNYRWLAVYSNKWRDEDNPPEILASTAHQKFVDAVDRGDWPYPEAWLWHVPGTRFGVADFVAYDDVGFPLASGVVDKGMEFVAEALAREDDLATSHGMPIREIERDTEDPTIITRYMTSEISPLPREAAANKHTGYEILREVKMTIPDNKRPWLEDKLGADGLKELEKTLGDKAKELEDEGIEFKEETPAESQQEPEQEEVEQTEPKEEAIRVEEPAPNFVTAEEVAEAVGAYLKPFIEQVQALSAQVEEQNKELKALKKEDEERFKEVVQSTPAASLFERIGSVIGTEETRVDGRSTLGKAGPKETEDERDGPTPVPLLNELMSLAWNRQ